MNMAYPIKANYSLIGARYMVVLSYVKTFFVNVNVLIRAHRLMSSAQKNKVQEIESENAQVFKMPKDIMPKITYCPKTLCPI